VHGGGLLRRRAPEPAAHVGAVRELVRDAAHICWIASAKPNSKIAPVIVG
jgi:hypothetical protein